MRVNKFLAMVRKFLSKSAVPADSAEPSSSGSASPTAVLAKESELTAVAAKSSKPRDSSLEKERRQMHPKSYEEAVKFASSHSKRRRKGCSECMHEFFVPRRLLRGDSADSCESNVSRKSATSAKPKEG